MCYDQALGGVFMNRLHFGDNLDVLRSMPSDLVDLVYLDPPFNSNVTYNVLYGTKRAGPSQAQSHGFEDMWRWGPDARRALEDVARRHLQAGKLLDAFRAVFGDSAMMAYLAMMGARLIELHRVLKPTGSLYLHCDPTASHYLKVLLDTIFGTRGFRTEISWRRQSAHNDAAQGRKQYGNVRDVLLFYTKSDSWTWNWQYTPYDPEYVRKFYRHVDPETGRRYRLSDITAPGGGDPKKRNPRYEFLGVTRYWRYSEQRMAELYAEGRIVQTASGRVPAQKRYLDEMRGVALQNDWTDISPLHAGHGEKLGYPTQKPLALLERIIATSTNPGDLVLDPFCGCGTAVEAAEKLGRSWIGIDITYLAIHVIEARLRKTFGDLVAARYELLGNPADPQDARALAARDWLEFQKWAVMKLDGLPMDRPGADKGIDGVIRYHRVGIEQPNRAIVSVKGGLNVGVDAVHKLKSVVQREGAETGVLVCLDPPTKAMRIEAANAGDVGPANRRVPKIQIVTVDMLFLPNAFDVPGQVDPPDIVAGPVAGRTKHPRRKRIEGQTEMLLPIPGEKGNASEPPRRKSRAIRVDDTEVIPSTRLGGS